MFLARREIGKLARVYEIRGLAYFPPAPAWAFDGSRKDGSKVDICDPGHCALGLSPVDALKRLHENDERILEQVEK